MAQKKVRCILAVELTKLQALAKPVDAAFEGAQDAQLVLNEKKAALDTVSTKYLRYGKFLVTRYRVKDDEEINPVTGAIEKAAPKKKAE